MATDLKGGGENKVWISKKKWKQLEKRIADLEKKIQDQPKEIISIISQQQERQMAKSIHPRQKW